MSVKQLSGWFAAAALASAVVSAQVPSQQPQQPEQKPAAAADQKDSIKVSGCIQKETDVLKRSAAATNMGMSDEYVLTEAKMTPSSTTAPEPAATPEPTGTSGTDAKFGKV